MSIRILHTADIHLDAPFRWLCERGQEQRDQVRRTFVKVCELAKQHDLMLIAGDLFDSNAVSRNTLEWTIGILSRIGLPVCILPGTHDCLCPDCVYSREEWQQAGNVRLFAQDGVQSHHLSDLGLSVHARPVSKNESASPLEGIRRGDDNKRHIAMAHGSVIIPGRIPDDTDCPIRASEIDAAGMDYVALGHWHSWYEPACRTKAAYPGSPEILKFGQSSASVASVTLTDGSVQVEQIAIGVRRCREETSMVDGITSIEALIAQVRDWSDDDLMLRLTLAGLLEAGLLLDTEYLSSEIADKFFHLEILDETHPMLGGGSLEFPDKTVIGRFVKSLREEIEKTQDERARKTAEDALQLGVALLQGKNVLR